MDYVEKLTFNIPRLCSRISVERLESSCCMNGLQLYDLNLKYCNADLSWNLLFEEKSNFPPDIIFDETDVDFFPDLHNIKCLHFWKKSEFQKLLPELCTQLLGEYRQYIVTLLSDMQRVHFQSLVDLRIEGICVTLFRHEKDHDMKENGCCFYVNFCLRLFQKKDKNIIDEPSTLRVLFPDASCSYAHVSISQSEELQRLGVNISIPTFDPHESLSVFVLKVQSLLQAEVEEIRMALTMARRNFTSALFSHFEDEILEIDLEHFTGFSLLCKQFTFFFVARFILPLNFPLEGAQVFLQSVYHEVSSRSQGYGEAFKMKYVIPHDPSWTVEEFVESWRVWVHENGPKFQALSCQEGAWNKG